MKIRVIGPKDITPSQVHKHSSVINTTTSSKTWSRALSPMLLGPVELYNGHTSKNMENAWQFSKRYEGQSYKEWLDWAKSGWQDVWAHRYPMGKGAVPLCSMWKGAALTYIQAREQIYIPLYTQAVKKSAVWDNLKSLLGKQEIVLWDFDGYSSYSSLEEVLNNPMKKMGHAFVLAMLLEAERNTPANSSTTHSPSTDPNRS